MMTYRVLATALLVVLISLNARAQQGNSIRGKVRNSSGVNMSQVIVSIETGNGSPFSQTATNNEGDFFFGGLTDTSYVLVISAPDYNPVSEHVEFVNRTGPNSPGESRAIDITLTPKGDVRPPRPGLNFVQNIPKAAQTSYESALKLSKQGKKEESIAALREAIRIFPDYFNAHLVLGSEFTKAGKHGEAIAQLDEARRINPTDDRTYELFGLVLTQQGKFAVAAAVFAEASRLNPLDPQYSLMRGMALIEQASGINVSQSKEAKQAENDRVATLNDAETSLKHAYELSGKKLAAAHLQLARVYEKRGQRDRAASELEQYLREARDVTNADAIRQAIKKLRTSQ